MLHIISHFNHLEEAFSSENFPICRGAGFMMTKSYEASRATLFVFGDRAKLPLEAQAKGTNESEARKAREKCFDFNFFPAVYRERELRLPFSFSPASPRIL
jgi:hypothetical protein